MILSSPHSLTKIPDRIISLVPSQTELLYALGLEEQTTGITKFCVHPHAWFVNKMKVGGTKSINIQKIRSLSPDLIIANKEENVQAQIEELAADYPVWVTDVNDLAGAFKMITDIGTLTGRLPAAEELLEKIRQEFDHLSEQAILAGQRVKTCYLIWKDPFMTVGADTFIHDMMSHAGFVNAFEWERRYPVITIEDIREKNCELILLSSEPYPFKEKHIMELKQLLPGVRIVCANGEMFSWYGSRLIHAPAYFSELHSMIFQ